MGAAAVVLTLVATVLPAGTLLALAVPPTQAGLKTLLVPWLFALPGILVTLGRRANPLGWLLLLVAALFALSSVASTALTAPVSSATAVWAVWFADRGSAVIVPLTLALLLLIPDGRLPSPAWRPAAFAALAAQGAVVLVWMLTRGPVAAPDSDLPGSVVASNPLGVLPPSWGELAVSAEWMLQLPLLLGAAAVVARLRRPGDDRPRLVSVLLAVLVFVTLVVLGRQLVPELAGALDLIAGGLLSLGLTSAVVRRQLPGVDVVIGHSFVYAVLTVLIAGGYVAAVAVFSELGQSLSPSGAGVLSAAIALALLPLRSVLQRLVHRSMHGDPGHQAVRRLNHLAEGVDSVDQLLAGVAGTVTTSLRADAARVELAEATGVAGIPPAKGVSYAAPIITKRGEGVLQVWFEPGRRLRAQDRQVVDELALHTARMVDAVQLSDELRSSREALVSAREEERLRLRRDLHDDLGPALAGLTMQLAGLGTLVRTDAEAAAGRLRHLEATSRDALERVRQTSRDLRPPVLDDLGLVAALTAHARECGLEPVVSLDASDLDGLSPAVEVAAYRIGAEALTNVARHAGTGDVAIAVTRCPGSMTVSVRDEGGGCCGAAPGVGTLSMRERAEELGGSLDITSGENGGTAVVARLPVGQSS